MKPSSLNSAESPFTLLSNSGHKMSETEKSFDPNDKTLKFVDRVDELDFLCDGFTSLRAEMSCGHAVTPMSLTNWCCRFLERGESRFVCGMGGCDKEWSYEEVCKMALLTPEEKKYFEKTMESIAERERLKNTKLCPECKVPVTREDQTNLRVRCHVCTKKKRRDFDFCWQCLNEWKGPQTRTDRCDNDGCCNEALRTLRNCPSIIFESVDVIGCPSIRACPTCGSLLEHSSLECKNVFCPQCRVEFCFVCLKVTEECLETSTHFEPCSDGVAPRQTFIPVWHQ